MRKELKSRNLTFTEIARLVGENWQSLSQSERGAFESQAQVTKDKYQTDIAKYKKTPEHEKYMVYLQEFKAKHAVPSQRMYMATVLSFSITSKVDLLGFTSAIGYGLTWWWGLQTRLRRNERGLKLASRIAALQVQCLTG